MLTSKETARAQGSLEPGGRAGIQDTIHMERQLCGDRNGTAPSLALVLPPTSPGKKSATAGSCLGDPVPNGRCCTNRVGGRGGRVG